MYAYTYDEQECRQEQALIGPTARDPIFAGEFPRALRVAGGEAFKSDCSGIRRLWLV